MLRFVDDVMVMDRGLPGAAWWRIVAKARLRCEDPDCGITKDKISKAIFN